MCEWVLVKTNRKHLKMMGGAAETIHYLRWVQCHQHHTLAEAIQLTNDRMFVFSDYGTLHHFTHPQNSTYSCTASKGASALKSDCPYVRMSPRSLCSHAPPTVPDLLRQTAKARVESIRQFPCHLVKYICLLKTEMSKFKMFSSFLLRLLFWLSFSN